jgi:hypothetical protein
MASVARTYIVGNDKPSLLASYFPKFSNLAQKFPWATSLACGAASALVAASPFYGCGVCAATVVGACVAGIAKVVFSKISTFISVRSGRALFALADRISKGDLKIEDQITTIKSLGSRIFYGPDLFSYNFHEVHYERFSTGSYMYDREKTKESNTDAALYVLATKFYEKKQYQNAFTVINAMYQKRPYDEYNFNSLERDCLVSEVKYIIDNYSDPQNSLNRSCISEMKHHASKVIDPINFYRQCSEKFRVQIDDKDKEKDEEIISSFAKTSIKEANLFACAKILFHRGLYQRAFDIAHAIENEKLRDIAYSQIARL